jgi:hypothetical protein
VLCHKAISPRTLSMLIQMDCARFHSSAFCLSHLGKITGRSLIFRILPDVDQGSRILTIQTG